MATRAFSTRNWSETFDRWTAGPSQTEQDKCDRAVTEIRAAIAASKKLAARDVIIIPQGSYRNRTNVRLDSDVDICVCLRSTFDTDYYDGITDAEVNNVTATYQYAEFKGDVEAALRSYFGMSAIARGSKAFDVHETKRRIDADVVPAFEHRRYRRRANGKIEYLVGTTIHPDNGPKIINWPEQNYANGTEKNDQTGRHFKRLVRIFKRLRNEMAEAGFAAADPMSSYLLECLIWNVPNEGFTGRYRDEVRYALIHLYNATVDDEKVKEWGEVNELKYLFRAAQPWNRTAVNAFCKAAWSYIGFE